MTPDRALKEAIMSDDAPKRAARPKRARKARKSKPFWVTLLLRGTMLVAMAVVLRMLIYTPQGEALIQQAAERMAELIGPPEAAEIAEADVDVPLPIDGAQALREGADEARPRVSNMPGSQGTVRRLDP